MKYYEMDMITGSLTASTSTAALLQLGGAVVSTTMRGLCVGVRRTGTDGSPDGLLAIDFVDAASDGLILSSGGSDDLGTDDLGVDIFSSPVPFFEGIWFTVTGDSDSNTQGYAFVPIIAQMEK